MLKLASCDCQGSVYFCESAVYRTINLSQVKKVMEILEVLEDGVEGVIETKVCDDDSLPIELKGKSPLTLRHRRVGFVSYPHEWCALMLKDSADFHLELAERLLAKSLVLKDSHPWNILFDRGSPVFVDFTSIVSLCDLFEEEYLEANRLFCDKSSEKRLAMLIHEIFTRMYQPYFSKPLLLYAYGDRDRVRARIRDTTLNTSTLTISLLDCLPKLRAGCSVLKKIYMLYKAQREERRALAKLCKSMDIKHFYTTMRQQLQNLCVAVGGSAYSLYYQQKGEDQGKEYSENWNAKQKSVYEALNSPEIVSLLDIACNTGWFALMAENMGKSVVAFDIDEACIEKLYIQVRDDRLNVLPLVIDFTQLTSDRYSIYDGNKVLINAVDRMCSDSVIALGIIHHLVLGLGMSFDAILDRLVSLSKKQIVIEFIDKDDAMIRNEPEFFPAYFRDRALISNYDIQTLICCINERGFDVSLRPSHPETRKILICNKRM